jgi:hypothetical protein
LPAGLFNANETRTGNLHDCRDNIRSNEESQDDFRRYQRQATQAPQR